MAHSLITEQETKVQRLCAATEAAKRAYEKARHEEDMAVQMLHGMRLMAESFEKGEPQGAAPKTEPPKRRMRLGAKKRVIYMLVQNGFETVTSLSKAVSGSDVSNQYIREVIRSALKEGYMVGSLDDKFILDEDGKSILSAAALPKDWDKFKELATKSPISLTIPTVKSGPAPQLGAIERLKALGAQHAPLHENSAPVPQAPAPNIGGGVTTPPEGSLPIIPGWQKGGA